MNELSAENDPAVTENQQSTQVGDYYIRNYSTTNNQQPPDIQLTENCALLNKKNMKVKLNKYKETFKNRSFIVDLLAIFFGIGSWIGINSIFLQLPLLVESAPEGWSLPSYLVVIIQIGNIGPIVYTLLQNCLPVKIRDAYMIYVVLLIGTIAALLTSFLYNHTASIGDTKYSFSLFILVFLLSLIGCTSSVLFMPYMGRFREIYLITYLIGEGLSGFLPSIVALIQGVGGNTQCILVNSTTTNNDTNDTNYIKYTPPPLFGTMEFFLFVFSIMLCSCVAFILLDNLKKCKSQYAAVIISNGNNYKYENQNTTNDSNNISKSMIPPSPSLDKVQSQLLSTKEYNLLLFLMAVICMFGNGVFPSIESYSCLPYGNNIYHLTMVLTSMANPIACFLAIFLPHTSTKSIMTLTSCTVLIGCYAVLTATLSPNPPWVGTNIGGAIMVIVWTLLMGLVSYIKLCITTVMRSQGGKSLVWTGGISQTGSTVGSILIFVLVNYTQIFVAYEPC